MGLFNWKRGGIEPENASLPPDDSDPVDEPFGTAPLSHEAVIELPCALSPDLNRHWLAALAARGDNLTCWRSFS